MPCVFAERFYKPGFIRSLFRAGNWLRPTVTSSLIMEAPSSWRERQREGEDRQALLASLNEQQRQREILAGELVINSPPPAEVDEFTLINTVMEVAGVEFDRAVLHLQQSRCFSKGVMVLRPQ